MHATYWSTFFYSVRKYEKVIYDQIKDGEMGGACSNHGSDEKRMHRAGWCSGNALNLYLGGTRFESLPGHRLF
jgi:hypothetical protein